MSRCRNRRAWTIGQTDVTSQPRASWMIVNSMAIAKILVDQTKQPNKSKVINVWKDFDIENFISRYESRRSLRDKFNADYHAKFIFKFFCVVPLQKPPNERPPKARKLQLK